MDKTKKRKHRHYSVYTFDSIAVNSAIKDVNPTLKAMTAILTIVICILIDSIVISSVIVVSMGALTIIKGKISLRHYIGFMLIPVVFIFLSSIAIAVSFSMTPVKEMYIKIGVLYLYISWDSILTAINVGCKSFGCVSALYMLTLSTSAGEMITVLKKARLPSTFTALMDMIYRFIFILSEQARSMNVSAKSRLGYESHWSSCCTFGKIAGNLFVISLKKAGTSYDAMVSRCYNGELIFLENEKPLKKIHVFISIVYFISLIFLHILILRIGGG